MSLSFFLPDEIAAKRFGAALAALLTAGDVIALSGPLGAGKSVIARACIRTRCGDPDLEVPSPTFTLVQTYDQASPPIWHMDFYRLEDPEEVVETGFEDALAGDISLIEWPEKIGPYLPACALVLRIAPDEKGTRTLSINKLPDVWQNRQAALEALL